jgi:hypothetical protein
VFEKPALFTYHPLAARRRPNLFPLVVKDFQLAVQRLRITAGPALRGQTLPGTSGPRYIPG